MSDVNAKDVIQNILNSGLKLSKDHDKLRSICESSGIKVGPSFNVTGLTKDPATTLSEFYKNLAGLPVIKIAAKMEGKKAGIHF